MNSTPNNIAAGSAEGEVERFNQVESLHEKTLNCMSCNEPLITVMQVSKDPVQYGLNSDKTPIMVSSQKIQSNCPFCNSKSWSITIDGRVMIGHVENNTKIVNYDFGDPTEVPMTINVTVSK